MIYLPTTLRHDHGSTRCPRAPGTHRPVPEVREPPSCAGPKNDKPAAQGATPTDTIVQGTVVGNRRLARSARVKAGRLHRGRPRRENPCCHHGRKIRVASAMTRSSCMSGRLSSITLALKGNRRRGRPRLRWDLKEWKALGAPLRHEMARSIKRKENTTTRTQPPPKQNLQHH